MHFSHTEFQIHTFCEIPDITVYFMKDVLRNSRWPHNIQSVVRSQMHTHPGIKADEVIEMCVRQEHVLRAQELCMGQVIVSTVNQKRMREI